MKKILLVYLAIPLFCYLPLVSCSRMQTPTQGELKSIKLKKVDSIPLEYGSLINITANPKFPEWAQLWFEDDNKTLRVVSVGFFDQKIHENVTVIPRN